MSGASQRSLLGPVLLNIFIIDIGSGIECTLSKFVDDTKLSGATNTSKERVFIQRDLGRLEVWVLLNFLKFNKAKVLHMG